MKALRRAGCHLTLIVGLTFLLFLMVNGGRPVATAIFSLALIFIIVPAMVLVAVFVAIFVHEAGHIVAGRAMGFRMRSMSVGPFEVRREGAKLRFGRALIMRGAGGFVRMVPERTDDMVRRLRIYIAGGPIASVLYTAVTYIAFRNAPMGRELSSALIHLVCLSLFLMAVGILPGALIPMTAKGGASSDMKLLLKLASDTPDRDRLLAHFQLYGQIYGGVRPRDWNEEVLDRFSRPEDGSDTYLASQLAIYAHHLDRQDWEAARVYLERALPLADRLKRGHIIRESAFLEAAYIAAWFDRDVEQAQGLRAQSGQPNSSLDGTRVRVDAAIALRAGDEDRARTLVKQAEEKLLWYQTRYGESTALGLDLVADIRKEITAWS